MLITPKFICPALTTLPGVRFITWHLYLMSEGHAKQDSGFLATQSPSNKQTNNPTPPHLSHDTTLLFKLKTVSRPSFLFPSIAPALILISKNSTPKIPLHLSWIVNPFDFYHWHLSHHCLSSGLLGSPVTCLFFYNLEPLQSILWVIF